MICVEPGFIMAQKIERDRELANKRDSYEREACQVEAENRFG